MNLEECDLRQSYAITMVEFGGKTVTEHAKDESKIYAISS